MGVPATAPDRAVARGAIVVVLGGEVVADTTRALRVLETSHPPVYYVPPGDYRRACFRPTAHESFCEFKGVARYFDLVVGERVAREAAWSYRPGGALRRAAATASAVYPGAWTPATSTASACAAQDGGFYGGWITSDVVGPFKGGPGTLGW